MHAPRSVRPNSDRLRDIEPTDDGNLHWSLAIVCIAPQPGPQPPHPQVDLAALFGAEVAASIKKKQKQAELPRKIDMLYFDSMGCDGQVHCKSIIEYLNYKWNKEHTELKEGENPPTDWPYKQRLVRLGSAAAHSESFDAADDVVWVNMVEKKAPIQKSRQACVACLTSSTPSRCGCSKNTSNHSWINQASEWLDQSSAQAVVLKDCL